MRYDFCVVGGGIVGLATAREILRRRPGASLVLLEKETDLAAHQTGHNSGVIHAGVYYAPGSLKARLCRIGNRETKQFCAEHAIPIENCGKLIVATTPIEVQRLGDLKKRSELNEIAVHEVAGAELPRLSRTSPDSLPCWYPAPASSTTDASRGRSPRTSKSKGVKCDCAHA